MSTSTTNNSIKHFSHPEHPLTLFHNGREFLCDGCESETRGTGFSFRCNACDFDLHEFCAMCPSALSSSIVHPEHPLVLLTDQIPIEGTNLFMNRLCDVCDGSIKGISYRCWPCDYDAHPLCTQLTLQQHEDHQQRRRQQQQQQQRVRPRPL